MAAVKLAFDVFEPEEGENQTLLTPIVFTHGLFWNKYMFRDLVKDLCEATNRKVYSLDLRNHGESPKSRQFDIHLMVKDVKLFLEENSLTRVSFVSHSISSTVIYLIAMEKPALVEKIVMIDHPPFATFTDSFFVENVLMQFRAQDRFLMTMDSKLTLSQAKMKILSLAQHATKGQKYFLNKVAYDLTKENNKFKWKTDHQFLCDVYKSRALSPPSTGSYDGDILIIRCKDSIRVSDEKYEAILKHNPKTKLVTFQDTTHLLMFEKQAEFVQEVQKYLSAVQQRTE